MGGAAGSGVPAWPPRGALPRLAGPWTSPFGKNGVPAWRGEERGALFQKGAAIEPRGHVNQSLRVDPRCE
jgi:hypothetical protein